MPKHKETPTKIDKKQDNESKKYILFSFIVIALALILVNYSPRLLHYLEKKLDKPKEVAELLSDKDKAAQTVKTLVPITEDTLEECSNSQKPHLQAKLNDYRLIVSAANQLMLNFLTDKPYKEHLHLLSRLSLPKDIKKILFLLDEYDTKYLNNSNLSTSVAHIEKFGLDSLIKRYFTIEKVSPYTKDKDELKQKIINELIDLSEFIFSADLQKQLVE